MMIKKKNVIADYVIARARASDRELALELVLLERLVHFDFAVARGKANFSLFCIWRRVSVLARDFWRAAQPVSLLLFNGRHTVT